MSQRLAVLLCVLVAPAALAQDKKPQEPPKEETFTPEETTFTPEETEQPAPAEDPEAAVEEAAATAKADKDDKLGDERVSWRDIVTVVRKPFLKMNRFEFTPYWGMTLNDNMIRHYEFFGQINYYLTDVLAVGLEGEYFVKDFLETYDLVARQDRRLPTINQYNYGAQLNFHYVPIYGKFAVLNKKIVHWEWYFTAGVGFTESEVIPRDPALPGWTNFLITPNVGVTMRVFLTKWMTLNVGVRDYIFIDKYESVNRNEMQSLEEAKNDADGKLVNHVMFQAGLSFWVPTSFRYTTFR